MIDRSMRVYIEVDNERTRAHAKHFPNSRELAPASDGEWLPILMEEVGEVAHELTYDAGPGALARIRKELVQVAAMACAWIEAIDREPAP